MSEDAARGQVAGSAAEVYESFFVPALFAQWPPVLLAAAGERHQCPLVRLFSSRCLSLC